MTPAEYANIAAQLALIHQDLTGIFIIVVLLIVLTICGIIASL